jgi:uncharacterized protein YjbI with pentapeptide repeats
MAKQMWRVLRYPVLVLVGLLVLAGIAFLVWQVPSALYEYVDNEKDRAAAEASTRTGMIAGLAGLAALGSLAITARTYQLSQQGQITERYTKAIEQLGSDKLDVRLGGIYALERIAYDSKRDHPTVVEMLSAFVRERTDPTRTEKLTMTDVVSAVLLWSRRLFSAPIRPTPATDVRIALTVLGRLPQRKGVRRADLSGAVLINADLLKEEAVSLSGARLVETNLSGARLDFVNLSRARLVEANLSGASLVLTDLSGAVLDKANLSGAVLIEAKLPGARLINANLSGALLPSVNLSSAVVGSANLSHARLDDANLSGAQGIMANLSDARLDRANLSGAMLFGADLSGARLDKTDLSSATLSEAKGLTQDQINVARGNAKTILPEGLHHPWRSTGGEPLDSSLPETSLVGD